MTELTRLQSDEDILGFISDKCEFGDNRAYILLAMARPKENDHLSHGDMPIFRQILTDEDSISRRYKRLKAISDSYIDDEGHSLNFRFYLTINARDIQSAFYNFQRNLIDLQEHIANGHDESRQHMKRLDSEWISTLQQDGNKEDNYFIIDIDKDDDAKFEETWADIAERTEIRDAIKTPNGFHIITEPFNYTELPEDEEIEIKTDGLIFLRLDE